MKVFFTKATESGVQERDVDGLDIVSDKYTIRVRTTGLLLINKATGEEKDIDLDLVEWPKKEK